VNLSLGDPGQAGEAERLGVDAPLADPQLRMLFHRLNNQLGIVLAHAELLEAKASDTSNRARAEQVVKSVLDAMGTAKEIRRRSEPPVAV
jgi:hypothetical protein